MPPWLNLLWPTSPGDWWAAIGALGAVLAIGVSIAAIAFTRRTATRQNELHARMVELETVRDQDRLRQERSAELRASIEREQLSRRENLVAGQTPRRWLVVRNDGRATAKRIRVLIDGEPPNKHPLIPQNEVDVLTLGSTCDFRYILTAMLSSNRMFHVRLEWADDYSEARVWESELKI